MATTAQSPQKQKAQTFTQFKSLHTGNVLSYVYLNKNELNSTLRIAYKRKDKLQFSDLNSLNLTDGAKWKILNYFAPVFSIPYVLPLTI